MVADASAQVIGLPQSKVKSRVVRSIVERPLGQSESKLQTDAGKKSGRETWFSGRPTSEGQQSFGGCRSGERLALTVKFEG